MKHKKARYVGTLVAVALMTYAFSIASPLTLVHTGGRLLANAAVGMYAGVLPNEHNSLAQALAQKEADLAAREARLSGVERAGDVFSTNALALASLAVSTLLLILVGLNFFFDVRRARRAGLDVSAHSAAIDLRMPR